MQLSPLVTIFVTPLLFGPNEYFETYPRTIKQDKESLEKQKCEFLFLPEKSEILEGIKKLKAPYSNFLCGKKRPGHFDGVITIVNRFLELINPEYCFFGQKDFQQQLIIRNHLKEKRLSTKLVVGNKSFFSFSLIKVFRIPLFIARNCSYLINVIRSSQ